MCDRGESAQTPSAVSRGQCFDRGARASARSRRQRIERNRRRTNDFAGSGIRQPEVKPEGLAGAGIAEDEVDQRRRMSAAATDSGPHLDALLPHRAGKLDAFLILCVDEEIVAAQSMRYARCGAGQSQCNARRHDGTSARHHNMPTCKRADVYHCTTRRAPTHRETHQAPSVSCASKRESFTPVFELWMNVCSPTYMPTCVTPPPGCAANSRMSPGRNASTTGGTSLPAR